MKPVSLADISYSQALQMLGMRKEALDAGQVQRLPSSVLSDSYFIRDAGQEVEKRAEGWMDTLKTTWGSAAKAVKPYTDNAGKFFRTPAGMSTAIGTGVGALGGLGKSFMDDEDDNYFGNAVTGALGGGALGLGAGLAFDSDTRKKLVNKATDFIDSFGEGGEGGEGGGPEAGDQAPPQAPPQRPSIAQEVQMQADAIPEGEMAQVQQGLAGTRGIDALSANANLLANTTAAGLPAAAAARYIPGSYGMDPLNTGISNPSKLDWTALGRRAGRGEGQSPLLRELIDQQLAGVPGAHSKVKFKTPNLEDLLDPVKPVRPVELIRGKADPGDIQGFLKRVHQEAGQDVLGKLDKLTPEAAAAYKALVNNAATPEQITQISKELGIKPGILSGAVKNKATLEALNRSGVAGEGIEAALKPQFGKAIAETIETKSSRPMVRALKRIPKGKLATILAAAGAGLGGLRYVAGDTLNEISREGQTRQALREELRRRLSSGGN